MLERWKNIPPELRDRNQWCYTNPNAEDGLVKAPRRRGGYRADKTNPNHWMDFQEACFTASQVGGDIGYCLSSDDPFTCIDLDVKTKETHPEKPWLWVTPDDLNRHWKIVQTMNSYTEMSTGGRGMHIWVYGDVGKGAHVGPIEVYSRDSFIICTGIKFIAKMIVDGGDNLQSLYKELRLQQASFEGIDDAEDHEEYDNDTEIFIRASSAENGDKFDFLTSLSVEDASKHYPSNSEADLALLSIFAFYTKSNSQVKRLFRYCPLSKREKSLDNDVYLDTTIKGIRNRASEKDKRQKFIDASVDKILDAHTRKLKAAKLERENTPLYVSTGYDPKPEPTPAAKMAVINSKISDIPDEIDNSDSTNSVPFPPGVAGEISKFVFSSAARPNREVAVVSTLGFLAGVAGKAFNFEGSGLNLYVILVGKSGIGKEHMHTAVNMIIKQVLTISSVGTNFVDSTDYRSAQALTKKLLKSHSFVHLYNEWGRKLKGMADERNSNLQDYRTLLTQLYHKSGQDSSFGGMGYSDEDKSLEGRGAIAYSMIGETTPDTFYGAISGSMMEDGFMGRFLHIETKDVRVPLNHKRIRDMSSPLVQQLGDFVKYVAELQDANKVIIVSRTDDASKVFDSFETFCDAKINESPDSELVRQLWNRASIKVMRIACLLAVVENFITPVVNEEQAKWAYEVVMRDVTNVQKRIDDGDLGVSDLNRVKKVKTAFRYVIAKRDKLKLDVASTQMVNDGIVPIRIIRELCSTANSFKDSRMSTSQLIDRTIENLISSGEVIEVRREMLLKEYNFTGRAFQLISE